jgi:hypothetical protein
MRSPVGEFERLSESAKMSLLSEQCGAPALAGVGRISAILLLAVLVGRLVRHVVARFALSICCLMHAFWTGTMGPVRVRVRRLGWSALRTTGPASGPAAAILAYVPNA